MITRMLVREFLAASSNTTRSTGHGPTNDAHSTVNYTRINAIGVCVIASCTIISAAYLLVSLARQGRGKLRVRMLLGMISSDVLIGAVTLPSEAAYLAGHPFATNTPECNAFAFLLTATLFTQHLWILSIAFITFLLLRHPLHPLTTYVERYSWTLGPIIWGAASLHSGLWWHYVGFVGNSNLCYYGSHLIGGTTLDARDLVQFIPRAFVFVAIILLYSTLYKFLRRPDTITLSSQFVQGSVNPTEEQPKRKKASFLPSWAGPRGSNNAAVNSEAPWEALEFVKVGKHRTSAGEVFGTNTWQDPTSSIPGGILLSSPHASPTSTSVLPNDPAIPNVLQPLSFTFDSADGGRSEHHRPSESTMVHQPLAYSFPDASSDRLISPVTGIVDRGLSPVLSDGKGEFESDHDSGIDKLDEEVQEGSLERKTSAEEFREFFQHNQATSAQLQGGQRASMSAAPQMSATAYFNRQASLLMLWFPLAYMFVFSISLVRLVYDMVHGSTAPALSLVSAWMVLSVGLIDAVVYGLAEYLVRRRVRRKMPDRI